MRHARVTAAGEYEAPPVARGAYGTMIAIRAGMASQAAEALAKAVTIATRFSVVRRQGEAVRAPARHRWGGGGACTRATDPAYVCLSLCVCVCVLYAPTCSRLARKSRASWTTRRSSTLSSFC
jgi:hypothetical protein